MSSIGSKLFVVMATLSLLLGTAVACKQSGSDKKNNNQTQAEKDAEAERKRLEEEQRRRQAGQSPAGSGVLNVTLNGTANGLVTLADRNLNLPVTVSGGSGNYVVGILTGPSAVRLSGSGAQYQLSGQLPAFVTTPHQVVLVARDLTRCGSAADCNVRPDTQGRLAQGQFKVNSQYDKQVTYQLQLNDNNGSSGGYLGGTNNGTGSFFQDAWDRLKQFFGFIS